MSMDKKDTSDKLFEIQKSIIDKLIKKTQEEYNKSIYPEKTLSDKLTCVICGGKYVRSVKCIHYKRKKHIKKLNEIYDNVSNFFIEISA